MDESALEELKNFVFDLHNAARMALRMDEVYQLYDIKLKEISEKYFAQSAWPDATVVQAEFGKDVDFLLFYRFAII